MAPPSSSFSNGGRGILLIRQFTRNVVRQVSGWDNRQKSQASHDEQPDLQGAQACFGVDADGFVHLLWRCSGRLQCGFELSVTNEVDAVEIELRLNFGRKYGAARNTGHDCRAEQSDQKRTGNGGADSSSKIVGRAPQRTDVAREFLW